MDKATAREEMRCTRSKTLEDIRKGLVVRKLLKICEMMYQLTEIDPRSFQTFDTRRSLYSFTYENNTKRC